LDKSKDRPQPSFDPPDLTQPRAILAKLLEIEMQRLETAVRIERERDIVFPETSVIIHDICKLTAAIERKDTDSAGNIFDIGGIF